MFTGIVEEVGQLRQTGSTPAGYQMLIAADKVLDQTQLGDSIAVNGVCLTVTDLLSDAFRVGVSPETLQKTNLGDLRQGAAVNLERAVLPTTRLGGHFVQGHVDGVGRLTKVIPDGESLRMVIEAPVDLLRYVVPKGFICLDGTSLTVVDVTETTFSIMLVAYTQAHITLPKKQTGDAINVEVDILGKYVEKLLQPVSSKSNLNAQFLANHGY